MQQALHDPIEPLAKATKVVTRWGRASLSVQKAQYAVFGPFSSLQKRLAGGGKLYFMPQRLFYAAAPSCCLKGLGGAGGAIGPCKVGPPIPGGFNGVMLWLVRGPVRVVFSHQYGSLAAQSCHRARPLNQSWWKRRGLSWRSSLGCWQQYHRRSG